MEKSESPLTTFTRKLKQHQAFNGGPNKNMLYLIYFKLLLSEPFRLIERRKFKEEVDRIGPEKSPVFIIGHWRSGTTFAHYLLSRDPGFFYQNKFQNFFSDNFLTTEDFFKPVLSRVMDFFSPVKEWRSNISKTMNLDTPSESDTALISEISEFTYHWAHLFPQSAKFYFDKYLFLEDLSDQELQEWRDTMRSVLNKVYLKNREDRLLIKNPGDTARMKYLLDIYPGAKFIFIHRNPYEVFYSNLKLWTHVLNTVALQTISEEEKKSLVLHVYQKLHQKYLEQKELLNPNQLVEISYRDITGQPLSTLGEVYEKLDLQGFDKAYNEFKHYIDNRPKWEKMDYEIQPEDVRLINKHWDFAFDLWGYSKLDPKSPNANIAG
ncbi:MAG: sulfotransferase [Bacteroidales bacterium]|nr:sulfotransferase [Bacteroidales bacterium]MCF8337047.1 sulfotransferase [Bacteroidales bacterium]